MSKRNAVLAYSRTNPSAELMFDKRVLGFNQLGQKSVYVPAIPQLAKALFQTELREARQRLNGHHYTPSKDYNEVAKKWNEFKSKKLKPTF